jgi:transketolase
MMLLIYLKKENMAGEKVFEHIAYNLRRSIITMTSVAGSGHPTSALSAADIVATLFFHAMRLDLHNYNNPNNDRFILSKGHASPVLYAVYKQLGILSEDDLMTYRNVNSVLEGHPTPRFTWSEAATGSLGQGLSIGAGMALTARMDNRNFKTYVLMGDSELSEGSVWEAIEIAAHYKLNNLIGIVDVNRLGQTTQTLDGYHIDHYVAKFQAFGWKTYTVDGHNIKELIALFDQIVQYQGDQPIMIVAKTVKGYGIAQAENKEGFHGKVFSMDELPALLAQLEERFYQAAHYECPVTVKPQQPEKSNVTETAVCNKIPAPEYTKGQSVMTRYTFGQALATIGDVYPTIVSLDAEVKNSTYAELFEQKFPERFVQCFIAEQNMVSMAVGMQKRGKIPFCSTFGAFFTRAYDQIRMACIGRAALRLVGSHVGVSIGQDGPSQMALEDIAMMRAVHGSCVLYPCDAVSTWKLVQQMVLYDQGISYMRTTRMATPVIYDNDQTFIIGGSHVLVQSDHDQLCLVAAGITLHEALKAQKALAQQNIHVAVIDAYSIKPIDAQTITNVARASGNTVITVEDHYLEGGLGQAVVCALQNTGITIDCMAVQKMPRSGAPQDLLAYEGIDAQHIVAKVQQRLG